MSHFLLRADDVLRRRDWVTDPRGAGPLLLLVAMVGAFGAMYGGVMGTFGGLAGERLWQVGFSAVKVPLLLLVTFLIGLPSFFVLNTLLGLRDDFGQAVRALAATQAGLAIILASLAPFTALWYASTGVYQTAPMFSAGMFAIASLGAQVILRANYRPLIRRNRRHRVMLWTWLGIYAFVGIQMGWTLRPFVGDPALPVEFFREESWGNAYVVVLGTLWDLIRP